MTTASHGRTLFVVAHIVILLVVRRHPSSPIRNLAPFNGDKHRLARPMRPTRL